jgi:cyclase
MEKKMFYEAEANIFQRAKELRNRLTDAEKILWMHLRTRPKGYKFRRQHPTKNYILDFYCHALKLAIEADGEIHNEKDIMLADVERQKNLEAAGIKFIRFTNEEITNNLNSVIEKLNFVIDEQAKK